MKKLKRVGCSRRSMTTAAALACLAATAPTFAQQPVPSPAGITATSAAGEVKPVARGDRYCEIMVVRRKDGRNEAEVWSTQGISVCPEDCKAAFDADDIKSETGAQRVVVNGPKIWLPSSPAPTPPADARRRFGGIDVGRVATIEVSRSSGDPYKERTVPRTTTNVFNTGEEVYELISPDGVAYVMQSMSLSEEPDLTMADLATLGSRLKLPKGWKYSARVLDAELSLAPNQSGEVVVLQDKLKNTYQRR